MNVSPSSGLLTSHSFADLTTTPYLNPSASLHPRLYAVDRYREDLGCPGLRCWSLPSLRWFNHLPDSVSHESRLLRLDKVPALFGDDTFSSWNLLNPFLM